MMVGLRGRELFTQVYMFNMPDIYSFAVCRCKAEMLEETYVAHLKQNVMVYDAQGRKSTARCVGSSCEV
jgi:hypothetical protein